MSISSSGKRERISVTRVCCFGASSCLGSSALASKVILSAFARDNNAHASVSNGRHACSSTSNAFEAQSLYQVILQWFDGACGSVVFYQLGMKGLYKLD